MTLREVFSIALTRERLRLKATQAELAESAGLSVGYIASLEGARRNPSLEVIEALAMALEVPPARLFERSKP
jgi:transcriptional regulator with XRE-family HTH domain